MKQVGLSLQEISISQIEGVESRISSTVDTDDLSKSLMKFGQFSPIRVRKHPSKEDVYEVIFGNRRLLTAKSLGWKTIIVDIVEASDTDALTMAFSENEDRKEFTDYEKAVLIEKLHLLSGKSYARVAEMLGKSHSYVSQHIAMLHLFPEGSGTEDEITTVLQQLTEKHARLLCRIVDPSERWATAKLAIKSRMGVRELERLVGSSRKRTAEDHLPNAHTRIKQIITEYIEGLNSKDLHSYSNAMSQKHFSKFPYFPPLSKLDREAAREHLSKVLRELKLFKATIQSVDFRIVGNIAYALIELRNRYALSDRVVQTQTHVTMILERENDDWKIVHEHSSTASPTKFLRLFTDESIMNVLVANIHSRNPLLE